MFPALMSSVFEDEDWEDHTWLPTLRPLDIKGLDGERPAEENLVEPDMQTQDFVNSQ